MRPLLYATLGALLLILGTVGVLEVRWAGAAQAAREQSRLQEILDNTLDEWESDIQDQLVELRSQVLASAEPELLLMERRRQHHWFDAVYLWEGGRLVWPQEAPTEDIAALRQDPCLAAAGNLSPDADHATAARLYLGCRSGPAAVAAFATSEAIAHLLSAEDANQAFQVLRSAPRFATEPLEVATARGLSPYRVLSLRMEYIRARGLRGDTLQASELFGATLQELLLQEGPVLEQIEPIYRWEIRPALDRGLQGGAWSADDMWARPMRRLAAWKELRDRIWSAETLAELTQGPVTESGTEGDPPYLLYVSTTSQRGDLTAVQVDVEALIQTFLRRFGRSAVATLSVREAGGRVWSGNDHPFLVYRNFRTVLPTWLEVGFTEAALPRSEQDRAIVTQILLIALGMVMGALALERMIRTDRETVQLLEAQREFLTRVTHELKTPLAGIRIMAETLEMGAARDPAQVEAAAGRIIGEADRLNERVNEVLKAARGVVDETPSRVDLAPWLEEIMSPWRPRVEQVGGTLEVESPPHLRTLVKAGLLRDALTNLLDNALKYRRDDRPLQIRVRVRTERRSVVFEVADNGIGVPPAMRTAIFERFRRVEGPGRGKAGGHGLGLSFVADAAQVLGGKAECRDGIDGGARFLFRIPLQPWSPDPPAHGA